MDREQVYDETLAAAWKAFNAAGAAAREVCLKATADAKKVYNDSVSSAWEVYQKASAVARKSYDDSTD